MFNILSASTLVIQTGRQFFQCSSGAFLSQSTMKTKQNIFAPDASVFLGAETHGPVCLSRCSVEQTRTFVIKMGCTRASRRVRGESEGSTMSFTQESLRTLSSGRGSITACRSASVISWTSSGLPARGWPRKRSARKSSFFTTRTPKAVLTQSILT